jgi:translocation and assembly module TamA
MSPAASRRRVSSACAAIVLLVCVDPARAQVEGAAVPQAPTPSTEPPLDPDSPLAPMTDLGVDWPDLAKPDAPAPTDAPPGTKPEPKPEPKKVEKATEAGGERRYSVQFAGLKDLVAPELLERFDGLSSLRQGEGKPANVAQIDRRAREDGQLLAQLLRAYGYYDAEVDTKVGGISGPSLMGGVPRLEVTLTATPGQIYRFVSISLPGLADTGANSAALRRAFGVKAGDPVSADKVTGGIDALKTALGQRGYAFATVAEPDISVDHDTHQGTLVLKVDAGRAMRFGAFHLSGKRPVFDARHVQRIARLHPGDRYDAALIEDLRRALIQTGLVSVAQVTPVRTADPDVFDLDVHLERAPPRTISGTLGYVTGSRTTTSQLGYLTTSGVSALGYGSGQGATAEVDWTHRNLFPPEGSLTLRGILGSQEQLASAIFRRNNFRKRDQSLVGQFTADRLNVPAFRARTLSVAGSIERQTNIIWQKAWFYSYGMELAVSNERDAIQSTGQPRQATYYVAALPLSLSYDGSDDLLNPTKGYRLSTRVSPEISFRGSPFEYARVQIDGSAYQPVGDHVVLAGRVRLGSILGAHSDDIAPTRRFYSGGGGSVRGFGYQKIGPRDVDNVPIGGSSLAEFALEARIRFGNFGVVPFLDGGNLYQQSLPRFTGLRYGTGLGFRYYTSFGPVRVDVGTPINRRPGDSRVAVYVSLGQAF